MYISTVTKQGQVSIPIKLRRKYGIDGKKIAFTENQGKIVLEPIKDFLELGGSLKTKIKATLKQTREGFENYLAEEGAKGLPKDLLTELGFKETAPNIFTPPKK